MATPVSRPSHAKPGMPTQDPPSGGIAHAAKASAGLVDVAASGAVGQFSSMSAGLMSLALIGTG